MSTTTEIKKENLTLDQILGTPGAENIITPEIKKPSVFTREVTDLSFLNNPAVEEEEEEGGNGGTTQTPEEVLAAIVAEGAENTEEGDDEDKKKAAGRPKTDKQLISDVVNDLIKEEFLVPFDDGKDFKDYTKQDFIDLIKENFAEKQKKISEEIPAQFFDSLPEQLQIAAKYAMDGGNDFKALFKALGEVEETATLDITTEKGQEATVRRYLQATNFGSPEEIEEELNGWKDRGELDKKAGQFKPKLDAMQKAYVDNQVKNQEKIRKQQEVAAQQYQKSVYDIINSGEINGIKLDKKVQGMLYNGLTEFNFPSMSGRPTNLLGHLLEKHQYEKPNLAVIAAATWLLNDIEGYHAKIREEGKNTASAEIARKLKTAQENRSTAGGEQSEGNEGGRGAGGAGKTIKRQKNIFARE